ncbi:GMC family oxidoreductase [Halomarina rubra]|uniref:GMC family oxidoreductase n=1 Tax=Halomarina rubra TaxID=2071873 RepID=A0ABD6AYP3_9EURY
MSDHTEVCVVGAGPAGSLLAARLAARGRDVVVLDAGPRFDRAEDLQRVERELRPSHSRPDVWEMDQDPSRDGVRDSYSTTGEIDYKLNRARVKGVGGTTLHWGAMTPRLHEQDFEMASRHGIGVDWPIDYGTLEPFYCDAEREMSVSGAPNPYAGPRSEPYPLPAFDPSHSDGIVREAFAEHGAPLHACPRAINSEQNDGRSACMGYGTCQPVCPSGAKYSADVHADRAEKVGARIVDRAPVVRLDHDESGDRVVAAVYERDGERRRVSADVFVLAAGAVEIPRLLLLSTSQRYPDGLANTSGAVGRYFMEHPGIKVVGEFDEPTRQHLVGYETSVSEAFYDHDDGPAGTMIVQPYNDAGEYPVAAALSSRPLSGRLADGDVTAPFASDEWGDALLDDVRERTEGFIALKAWVEQLPEWENRVALDRSRTDDRGHPVPDLQFSVGEHASASLRRAESFLYDVLESAGATEVKTVVGPDEPWFAFHHLGTTRMGTDPESSVVNAQLRTHDLDNCYVASSSVFPTGGAANPTLTIAALSLRLADHLDGTL